eukprot:gene15056-15196_t
MVDSQLRVSGVNDPAILAAFAAEPREDHVPEAARAIAYIDRAVPLGNGAVLAPALTHGQMLTAAEPVAADHVLVIGRPGTYLAALVARLGAKVTLAAPNGDGAGGDWAMAAPYSLVLIDGAIGQVPPALVAVLADQGRVVTGLIERGVARLAIGRRVLGDLVLTSLGEGDFAALPEFAAKKSWSF